MSSNMYGFTCEFDHKDHPYFVQIVYVGTRDDDEETKIQTTSKWETEDPARLAEYELKHRDWSAKSHGDKRLMVWGIYGEAASMPTPREVLEIIASGKASNIQHGWDT